MDRVAQAEQYFRTGYNCAQAVFLAYADIYSIDEKQALMMASSFGAGIGKMRETCGVVTAMAMVVGLSSGYSDPSDSEGKKATYHLMQEMAGGFKKRHKTLVCRELLGIKPEDDLPETAVRTEEYYKSRPCLALVRSSCEIIEEYIIKN